MTTLAVSTLESIRAALDLLVSGGVLVLVIYHGHPAGKDEKNAVLDFAEQLPQKEFHVLRYQFVNQKNDPPFVVAIEKR
ncbi:hypothetical protein MFLO_02192 [Listeria floridensis FSL S10-1187]|uniref:rRNA methylase n=1 Tax=Listeria floridensis FSL S10-1187 TaxID=1265817 RepID=A0ABN0RI48_9LIST|nr:hypothetical protein MFLO_02192 [Listeria floridensis FSL S10-1187]